MLPIGQHLENDMTNSQLPPLYDEPRLSQMIEELGAATIATILESLCRHADKSMESIKGFAETGDIAALRREAHSLKGAAAMACATRLEAIASRLEMNEGDAALAVSQLHDCTTEMRGDLRNRQA